MHVVDAVGSGASAHPKRRTREPEGQPAYPRDAQLDQVLRLMPVAVLVSNQRGQIVSANAAATKLFGYASNELIGVHADVLFPPAAGERLARCKDGKEFPAELTAIPISSGGKSETLTVVMDRTDHHALRRSREQLAHLARISTLGELSGSLAHELNQPLTAILSNAQAAQRFLAEQPVNLAELREIMDDLVSDNHRASEVLRKIRVLVRRGEFAPDRLSLAEVIGDATLLVRSDAIARRIRIQSSMSPDLPFVYGDRVQLQQVVLNLLLNSFEAMEACSAEDRVVKIDAGLDGAGMIRVSVRDRGRGLGGGTLEKLFVPYFTSKPEGLGLGLSISRSIVEMHGGCIGAKSNEGKGATFYFTLPLGCTAAARLAGRQP